MMQRRMAESLAGSLAATLLAFILSGCGKSNTTQPPSGAPSGEAPAPAAPVETAPALTDAQKKALLGALPAEYQSPDLANGEAKFAACRACHTLNPGGADTIGPNLWGIFGRKAGTRPAFSYSDEMKRAGWVWDADHINKCIENPKGALPGTKMTLAGVPNPNDRRDLIAYLKVQTSAPPKG